MGYEGRESGFGSDAPKPVKVGDEIEVTIEAVAAKGDGIAKKDGFVIFIKGAQQGQTCKIRITDVRQRFAVGELVQ
ncbi:MAG: TRAM domain-containing protein [Candidatus Micrarchaeota archaeon]|nr:TRAM domain-containing protein [Candidatus Micrarchaeota archaeon]